MNNTGAKYVRIMKKIVFWREEEGEYGTGILFLILAHPVYKVWIIQEPNTLELWNKLHFEGGRNGAYITCLKYSEPIFVE